MDLNTSLQELGFSEYEARAFAVLARDSGLNGYEVAKRSGIPRANVYAVLEKLVLRRAIRRYPTRQGTRYAALPPEQVLNDLNALHTRALADARNALARLTPEADTTPLFHIADEAELQEQARALIDSAATRLLVAIQPAEAALLAPALRAARERGVSITTLCMQACATECGGCQGDIHRYCLAPADTRWLLLVADDRHMLAAEMHKGEITAFATEQRLITELAAAYIRQSLALALMAGELDGDFRGLLSKQALKVLDALHPEGGFLAHLKGMTETAE
jgi:sugar-specific transcriptional regulator TrmB